VQRRPYHHGFLRERLLELGRQALVQNRFHDLSLRDLAKEAGVSHAAPYRHFADREALRQALLIKELELLTAEARQIDSDQSLTAPERFRQFGLRLIQLSALSPERFALLLTSSPSPNQLELAKTRDQLTKIFLRWAVSLKLKDPLRTIKLVWVTYIGSIQLAQSHWTQQVSQDLRNESVKMLEFALSAVFKASN